MDDTTAAAAPQPPWWFIPRSELHLNSLQPVKQGSVGDVCKGKYLHKTVAAKVLRPRGERALLRHEVQLLASARHPNVVLFLGANLDDERPFCVLEYAARGSLEDLLLSGTPLDVPTKLQFAEQVAKGLIYLHGRQAKVIHLDLKPDNILVFSDFTLKICDFGLARVLGRDGSVPSRGGQGSPHYMAPECLSAGGGSMPASLSDRSDVFSFGMLLYRMFAGQHPFTHILPQAGPIVAPWVQIFMARLSKPQWRPPTPPPGHDHIPEALWAIIRNCWAADPLARPPMAEVLQELQGVRAGLLGCPIPSLPSQLSLSLFAPASNPSNPSSAPPPPPAPPALLFPTPYPAAQPPLALASYPLPSPFQHPPSALPANASRAPAPGAPSTAHPHPAGASPTQGPPASPSNQPSAAQEPPRPPRKRLLSPFQVRPQSPEAPSQPPPQLTPDASQRGLLPTVSSGPPPIQLSTPTRGPTPPFAGLGPTPISPALPYLDSSNLAVPTLGPAPPLFSPPSAKFAPPSTTSAPASPGGVMPTAPSPPSSPAAAAVPGAGSQPSSPAATSPHAASPPSAPSLATHPATPTTSSTAATTPGAAIPNKRPPNAALLPSTHSSTAASAASATGAATPAAASNPDTPPPTATPADAAAPPLPPSVPSADAAMPKPLNTDSPAQATQPHQLTPGPPHPPSGSSPLTPRAIPGLCPLPPADATALLADHPTMTPEELHSHWALYCHMQHYTTTYATSMPSPARSPAAPTSKDVTTPRSPQRPAHSPMQALTRLLHRPASSPRQLTFSHFLAVVTGGSGAGGPGAAGGLPHSRGAAKLKHAVADVPLRLLLRALGAKLKLVAADMLPGCRCLAQAQAVRAQQQQQQQQRL